MKPIRAPKADGHYPRKWKDGHFSGAVNINGVAASVVGHTHSYVPASSYTAADVLAKLLTVDGSGSGLDADLLDGMQASASASASTIAQRDGSGYLAAVIFNSNFAADNIAASWYYYDSGDGYHRKKTVANARQELGVNGKASRGQLTSGSLGNTLLETGMYTTSDGANLGLGGAWWHVWHGYHAADGYAAQLAIEYYGNDNMKFRSASGTSWGSWRQVSTVGHGHGLGALSSSRYDYSGTITSGARLGFNTDSEYCFAPCTEGGSFVQITTGTAAPGYYTRTGLYNPTGNNYAYFVGWRKLVP